MIERISSTGFPSSEKRSLGLYDESQAWRAFSPSGSVPASGRGTWWEWNEPSMNSPLYFAGAPQPLRQRGCERNLSRCYRRYPYLWSAKDNDWPPRFEDWLSLASSRLDGTYNTQSPLQRRSHVLVNLIKIVPNDADLIPISCKQGAEFLIVHASVYRPLADLESVRMNNG